MPSFTTDAAAALDVLRRRNGKFCDPKQAMILLSEALTAALRDDHQRCVEKLLLATLIAADTNRIDLNVLFGYWNFQRLGLGSTASCIAYDLSNKVDWENVALTAYTAAVRNNIDFGTILRNIADESKTCTVCGARINNEEDDEPRSKCLDCLIDGL